MASTPRRLSFLRRHHGSGINEQSPIAVEHGLQRHNTKVANCLDWTTTQKTSFKWQIINMQEKIILRYRIYQTISVFSMLHTTKNARFWSMPWVNWCMVNSRSWSKICICLEFVYANEIVLIIYEFYSILLYDYREMEVQFVYVRTSLGKLTTDRVQSSYHFQLKRRGYRTYTYCMLFQKVLNDAILKFSLMSTLISNMKRTRIGGQNMHISLQQTFLA